jgi:hypothetical protein
MLTRYELNEFHLEVWKRQYARQEAGQTVTIQGQFQLLSELAPTLAGSRYTGTVRVIAIENRYARRPFPKDLFCGPFDQRRGWKDQACGPVWIGETLGELYREGVPLHLL